MTIILAGLTTTEDYRPLAATRDYVSSTATDDYLPGAVGGQACGCVLGQILRAIPATARQM
jgi:hypothetical protein